MKIEKAYKFLFHCSIRLISIVFLYMQKRVPRFYRATASYDAVYRFCYKNRACCLVFNNGKIRVRRDRPTLLPNLEVTFLDFPGAMKKMKADPGNVLMLLIENLINIEGNTYYLFKLGYLAGLCENYFQNLPKVFGMISRFSKA